jgi:hypothetical protein
MMEASCVGGSETKRDESTATTRVYHTRPYTRFSYKDAGKSLCAPGDKWAARDFAAFEAEFKGKSSTSKVVRTARHNV